MNLIKIIIEYENFIYDMMVKGLFEKQFSENQNSITFEELVKETDNHLAKCYIFNPSREVLAL